MNGAPPPPPLSRLLRPRSIAVFGGQEAERVIAQCDKFGFAGPIWPVNPRREAMGGRPCLKRAEELPEAPDAVFLGIRREETISCVAALAEAGAGGVVCYASGFGESDAELEGGAALDEALRAAAGVMPLLGPNCYGLLNASIGAALWPDQHGLVRATRGAALVMQSSNLAINLTMQRRGLPISHVVTCGNQLQTGISALAEALLEDPAVSCVGLYVEGIDSATGFVRMAQRAHALKKPVIALRVGRTETARAAALTHTASLTGHNAVADAFFRRLGIAQLRTLPELVETLKLLHIHGPLPGSRLCSMSCSGGEAALIADAAEGRNIAFPPLSGTDHARVKETLPALVSAANPLDYHTFYWADEERMARVFRAMLETGYDLGMLVLDYPRTDRCDAADWRVAEQAFGSAVRATGTPGAVAATLSESMPEDAVQRLAGQGIAALGGLPEALAAAEAAAMLGAAFGTPLVQPHPPALCAGRAAHTIFEAEAKQRLAQAGAPVPGGGIATGAASARELAARIGYPVVVKRAGLGHKSDADAIRLGIAGPQELDTALAELAAPGTPVLVEQMIADSVFELMVGVLQDPVHGIALVLGAGGIDVELSEDRITLLLPATPAEIGRALRSLRTAPRFDGYRGRPKGDFDACVRAVVAIAGFALQHANQIEELDVNPLIVRPEGQGAVIADALLRMQDPPAAAAQPVKEMTHA